MLRGGSTRSISLLALLGVMPFLIGSTGLTSNFDARVLAAQNRERIATGIRPLVWDSRLEASAQSWANQLAVTGRFEHAPENGGRAEGENLWAGTKDYYTVEAMIDAWVREKRFYRHGIFPDNSTTGQISDVGHYTQLMWRQSRSVGCALAAGSSEEILVCRYSDAGNYIGERPF